MNICVFCGANRGKSATTISQVEKLMDLLIAQNATLVYGGGKTGLMGLIADRFLQAEAPVIGVRPTKLIELDDADAGITLMIVGNDMFELMSNWSELADVFVALPGGIGTLDEMIEVYTQVKIGFAQKLCTVLDVDGFYQGLQQLLEQMVQSGFLKEVDRQLLHIHEDPHQLADLIVQYQSTSP